MSTRRLTPTDAQTYWLSAKIPNDTFLLFGFAGVPPDLEAALDDVASRARRHPDLTVRIEDGGFLTYPAWVHRDVDRSQFVVHDIEDRTWAGCLPAVSTLIDDQLDAGTMTWRLHVFTGIDDVPGSWARARLWCCRSHTRSAAAAAPPPCGPDVRPRPRRGARDQSAVGGPLALPVAGFRAARAHRRMLADIDAGSVPPRAELRPPLRTNARPSGQRSLRTVVRKRADLAAGR